MSAAERERAVTRILLDRIARTPDVIDLAWLREVCVYTRDVAGLRAYCADLLLLGEQKHGQYVERQTRAKKAVTTDSRFFISQVREEIYAARPSAGRLDKYGRAHLAVALFMQSTARGGLENVDEAFMSAFLKELVALFSVRRELAARAGDDTEPWLRQQQQALEVAVLDRYVRLGRAEERIRERHKNTQGSAAAGLVKTDLLQKSLYENLLRLGQLNLSAAEAETEDRKHLRVLADRAFAILAMVYQRTHSPDALAAARRINEIQRGILHRLARTSWKRAQLAAAAGRHDDAAEHYFRATQFFNEAMAQSVGPDRDEVGRQFVVLKREIAAWHATRQSDASAAAASP